jgi:hypothetical protein
MRRFRWLLPICIVLYGCPYESKVPLETGPVEPVDTSMFGYWYGIVKDGSDFFGIEALDISRQSDSTYSIIRYGKAAKGDIILPDTAYFTGYASWIGERRFMNIESSILTVKTKRNKPPEILTQKIYYLALFELTRDTLRLKTISENFFKGKKGFRSAVELKEAVTSSAGEKDTYDDIYSLDYRKIKKPI